MKRCALLICIVVAPLFAAEHSSVATINSRIQTVSTCCPKGIFLDTHLYIADDQPFYISPDPDETSYVGALPRFSQPTYIDPVSADFRLVAAGKLLRFHKNDSRKIPSGMTFSFSGQGMCGRPLAYDKGLLVTELPTTERTRHVYAYPAGTLLAVLTSNYAPPFGVDFWRRDGFESHLNCFSSLNWRTYETWDLSELKNKKD